MLNSSKSKVIVKIDKRKLDNKREKEGNFYIPSHLQDYTRNLQYGEVVSFGSLAKELCPEIEVGSIAIFHHIVEHKVVNKNIAEGTDAKKQIDERIIKSDDDFEYRFLFVDRNPIATELFGVLIDEYLHPSKEQVFCYPMVRQTDYQLIKGIYVNSETDLKNIEEQLEIVNHGKSEMFRVLQELPSLHEKNEILYENTKKSLSEFEKQIDVLTDRKRKIVLDELIVAATCSIQTNNELKEGDKIFIDSKRLYPLEFMGLNFALIRMYDLIIAKEIDGEIYPLNNYLIVNQHSADERVGSIIIPENARIKPLKGSVIKAGIGSNYMPLDIEKDDVVVFNKKGNVEIFIDEKSYLIVHNQNVIYKLNNNNMKAQPLADRVFVRPSKVETTTESGIIIPDVAIEKPSKGTVISVGIGYPEKPMELKEGDNVMFQVGAGIPMEIQGETILVVRESEIICTI